MNAAATIIVLVIVLIAGYAGYAKYQKKKGCPSGQSCQSTPPAPGPNEVYAYDMGAYGIGPVGGVAAAAEGMGATVATVATLAQLTAAQQAGAEWCHYAWTNNAAKGAAPTDGAYFPMQTAVHECGGIGVNGPNPMTAAGVTLYGPKPPQGTLPLCAVSGSASPCVLPWNGTSYNAPNSGS